VSKLAHVEHVVAGPPAVIGLRVLCEMCSVVRGIEVAQWPFVRAQQKRRFRVSRRTSPGLFDVLVQAPTLTRHHAGSAIPRNAR
jgi:hypothetical protein